MRLLDFLKQTLTPEAYDKAVYRLSGYTDAEIKQLPPDADAWLDAQKTERRPSA